MIEKANEKKFKYLTEDDQRYFKASLEHNKELIIKLSAL